MSRELIVKEVQDLEKAVEQIKNQCFVRKECGINYLEDNKVQIYTRDHVFLLKLVKQPAEWKVLK